ncbi:uncharacterized protein BKA55DRAFT_515304 [Fusarium redolens]|uniref:ABC-type Fe3+ transport system n=1 Tax=Fusarium redolens TaxID=48865 RepID=A0A9P9K828_FUSRE|nr:uncharacterized protein BKA55DRAFT_676733 [Fusarium redolens]XP_046047978.1 uncharacterized protein BKA55DRAFT_515304 [Fusarium redolens]KAH7247274.1 hypothetical protein BKA55DRAFT_676733 [Fusarium redolens]KAH7247395.1 hypothetical protein BKA55DRAFT_515304 [Fusarium redolens]
MRMLLLSTLFAANGAAYDSLLGFDATAKVETRSIDQIYKAALKEGGVVTSWFGGDEKNQQDAVKKAFEAAFPGVTLNLTVDVSKYHGGNIDEQLASNNVYVDTVALQTTHDFPRWKEEGALLHYAPVGFDKIYPDFRDIDAAFYGYMGIAWQFVWNSDKLKGKKAPAEFPDFLAPEYKGKLALTYPNDDDAILFQFDLILNKYGTSWFKKLIGQKPRWVRGTATGATLVGDPKSPYVATFTSALGLTTGTGSLNATFPKQSNFVSWPQHTAILKDAPHPEGAKLLQNFLLSKDFQKTNGFWPVRSDVAPAAGFPELNNQPHTNPGAFAKFMSNRERVERLRFWFEKRLGTAQGLSPLDDDL